MAITDRRSGQERRAIGRRDVTVDVEWESDGGRKAGTISDLSPAGCFVLCTGDVSVGDVVKVYLPLGDGMKVQIEGEVRNQVHEIGFAMEFRDPTEAQIHVINGLMESHRSDR